VSAKWKLNAAHLLRSLLVAGLLGWLTELWAVFAIAVITLLAAAYHAGDIRQ
jgi:hypothetical protein